MVMLDDQSAEMKDARLVGKSAELKGRLMDCSLVELKAVLKVMMTDCPSDACLVEQSAEMKEKMMDCPSDVSLAKKSADLMGADLADQSVDLKVMMMDS